MNRDYIKIKRPSPLPNYTHHLRELDDDFWKSWVFFHLLSLFKNYDKNALRQITEEEKKKPHSRIERAIARFIRSYLRNNREFDFHFDISGEQTNDEDVEGNYDITISNTYWENPFYFECKNLDESQDYVNKYVCSKIYPSKGISKNDGGVYRYFNGKYAQNQRFGGMLGFILKGKTKVIKHKIFEKLKIKFDISPEGDLKTITDNSIEHNVFTFDSIHSRFESIFTIHHLLFQFGESDLE